MQLKNIQIQYLYNWLNVALHGEESRARNKFARIIEKQYQDSLNGRTEILQKYSDKDAEGKPIIENGVYKMSDEVLEKAKAEMSVFLDNVVEYKPKDKSEKVLYKSIFTILKNYQKKMDMAEGSVYDEVMVQFESVK